MSPPPPPPSANHLWPANPKAICLWKIGQYMMMRGYLNPYHLSHSFMAGQSIGSDCVWKFGQLYGEGLFKCHHHLGQSLWPANQKQFFMKNWTIYDERHYLNITTWANCYRRPIKSKLFMKIWTMYGERPIYMANPFSHHLMDVLHPK